MYDTAIYVARHERAEALEAYGDCLNEAQRNYIKEHSRDFWLKLDLPTKQSLVLEIEDEG